MSNLVLALVASRVGAQSVFRPVAPVSSERLFTAVPIGDNRLALTTLDNALVIATQEGQELARAALDFPVGGLTYLSDAQRLLVGTADGHVSAYGLDLGRAWETNLKKGRVLGLAGRADGRAAVATGIGANGDRFYLSLLDSGGQALFTYKVGWMIGSVGALRGLALAGDDRAWVTAVSDGGALLWKTQLTRGVTALQGWEEERAVLAGDQAGKAYLLDGATGRIIWQAELSQFKITAIQPLGHDGVLYADYDGGLFLLGRDGSLLRAQRSRADMVVGAWGLDGSRAALLRRGGQVVQVDAGALRASQVAAVLRSVWVVLDVVSVLLLLTALARAIKSWRQAAIRVWHELKRSCVGYLFLLPAAAGTLIFTYVPAALAVRYSLTNYRLGAPMRFVGLDNFVTILTADRYFWLGAGNVLIVLAAGVLKVLTVPLFAALLIYHLRSRFGSYFYRTVYLVPSVVPGIIGVLIWKMIYAPGDAGFLNNILTALGLGGLQHVWLGDERTALAAIVFAGFPWVGAFSLLIYLGGLINMNVELLDAAAIDGAGPWRRLIHIEWPLLAPQRSLLLFFVWLGTIQDYAEIYVYTQGGPGHATYVPALQLFLRLFRGGEVGYASAIGFVLLIVVLLGTLLRRSLQREDGALYTS